MADINVGKFINNLDKEDLSSEDLQGVVNNVYAKAISDHKKLKKAAEDNTKEQDKETATFVKANHDRLKAHKNKPEKDIDKDDATAKDKVAKEINESKKLNETVGFERFKSNITPDITKAFKKLKSILDSGSNDTYVSGWYFPEKALNILQKAGLDYHINSYYDLTPANILNMISDNDTVEDAVKELYDEYEEYYAESWAWNFIDVLKKIGKLGKSVKESQGSYTLNTGKRKSQKGKFNDSTTFEQWYNATFDSPSYRNSEYYPFNNYVKIFSSAESLRNATADDIVKNAHRFYDVYDVDSADREYAFNFARDVTGIDYDDLYNAWSSGEPLAENKKLKESEDEFEVAKYKGNQYGIWSKSSKNWMTFGKKADLEKRVKELNAKKSCKECTKESLRKSGKRLKEAGFPWEYRGDSNKSIVDALNNLVKAMDEVVSLFDENAEGVDLNDYNDLEVECPIEQSLDEFAWELNEWVDELVEAIEEREVKTESKNSHKGKRLKESAEDKVVIYKEFGKYRATPESNYNSKVQNERRIQKLDAFNSADEIINYYIKYGWAKSPDEFIVKESKNIKGKKRLTEAEDGNMTIETSTSILDMFYPSLYQTIDDYYIPDGEWGRVDDILARTSMDFAEDAIKEVFPNATLKFKELRHPRQYNFGGENIIFDVTLPKAEYEKVKQEVAENPEFAQFLKKNSPRDGYIPFGAYTVDKFKTQDDMYSIGQIVKFFADNEDLQYGFDDKFREEIGSNFETYDYLWEEVMDWLKEHDQAYQDFLTHFNADEGSVIDLDSIIGWISEHDTLAQDFENYFGFSINESLKESVGERFTDKRKQAAYENAIDCITYGYGKSYWNSLDLNDEEKKEVWKQAFEDIAEDESLKEDTDGKTLGDVLSKYHKEDADKLVTEINKALNLYKNGKIIDTEFVDAIYNASKKKKDHRATVPESLPKRRSRKLKESEGGRFEPEELDEIFKVGAKFKLKKPLTLETYEPNDWDYDWDKGSFSKKELAEMKELFKQELKDLEQYDDQVIDKYIVLDKREGAKLELPAGFELRVAENIPNTKWFNNNPWFAEVVFDTADGQIRMFYNSIPGPQFIARNSQRS